VIVFDRRGVGLSDSVTAPERVSLLDWVADAVAVLDAVGSDRAAVFSSGPSSGLIALQLAADHPHRVSFLSVYDAIARYRWAPDYPWGVPAELDDEIAGRLRETWATPRFADRRGRFAATAARHPGFVEWATTWFRRGVGPTTNAALANVLRTSDVRAALATITCPTLVINHAGVGDGRYLADHIVGARYLELHDPCHLLFSPELDEAMAVTAELVGAGPVQRPSRRILTTLMCVEGGDSPSRGPHRHDDIVRRHVARFDGRELTSVGPGALLAFDGPTRAVQCALAICDEADRERLSWRVGVHTGEVELRSADVHGLNVHVAQRMCGMAASAQVLVSQRVVDLVAGSELRFDHLGDQQLKGLPGRWSVFEAAAAPQPLLDVAPAVPAPPIVDGRAVDLSARERDVLAVLATGASNAGIASTLYMSEATVKAHVSHLFVKVGCTNRVQLALYAHHAGIAQR
jgi:DNA-binding CsgD family transcriptional regulator/pimeloyl-ACP methyl ester carboxylesterase